MNNKTCITCSHWVRPYKTHGHVRCELSDRNYCVTHERPYWRGELARVFHSLKEKQEWEFIKTEEFTV